VNKMQDSFAGPDVGDEANDLLRKSASLGDFLRQSNSNVAPLKVP
jgi:hypothetical protein